MKKQKTIVGIYVKTIDVEETPNFIVPSSNFSSPDFAYLLGIPCKVVSNPYITREKNFITGGERDVKVYDVISMATGIKYTIPTGWAKEYDTLEEANEYSYLKVTDNPDVTSLIGRKYWPRDNSYIRDFEGKWESLIMKECEIVSVPFKENIYDEYISKLTKNENQERPFILVKYGDRVYRTLFEEWALID